jgi:hypothetical protein
LAELLKDIIGAALRELDKSGDDINEMPRTREALHRYMVGAAYVDIDCEAAAEQLLRLAGKWAPGKDHRRRK